MAAKTNAEIQADYRKRNREAGLKELRNLWCHPDDEAAIRDLAAKLATKREKAQAKAATA